MAGRPEKPSQRTINCRGSWVWRLAVRYKVPIGLFSRKSVATTINDLHPLNCGRVILYPPTFAVNLVQPSEERCRRVDWSVATDGECRRCKDWEIRLGESGMRWWVM